MLLNKFCVANSKGGVGKTPFSYNAALDHGFAIGTNEQFHCYDALPSIEDESIVAVPLESRFPKYPDEVKIIFDLAGAISQTALSLTSAIEYSELVVVPINDEFKALNGGVNTIHQIQKLNKPVLVIATQLKKERKEVFVDWSQSREFNNIQETVHKTNGDDIKVLPLKYSTAFDTIFAVEKSVKQICKDDKLLCHSFKVIDEQLDDIYDYMSSVAHKVDVIPKLHETIPNSNQPMVAH